MRETLKRVAELQPQWSHKNNAEMQERGQLVRHAGPDWLGAFSTDLAEAIGIPPDDLIVEGRDGTGPKTEVPWFRFGSRSSLRCRPAGRPLPEEAGDLRKNRA